MLNDVDVVISDVDTEINAGDSFLVDDPSNFGDLNLKIKSKSSLKVILQNIRSVNKNLDDFSVFLTRSQLDYDFIVLTECWLQGGGPVPDLEQI